MSILTSVTMIILPVQCFNSEWHDQGSTSSPESRGRTPDSSRRWRSTRRLSTFLPSSDHPLPNHSYSTRPRAHYRYNRPQGHVCLCVTQLRPISPNFPSFRVTGAGQLQTWIECLALQLRRSRQKLKELDITPVVYWADACLWAPVQSLLGNRPETRVLKCCSGALIRKLKAARKLISRAIGLWRLSQVFRKVIDFSNERFCF